VIFQMAGATVDVGQRLATGSRVSISIGVYCNCVNPESERRGVSWKTFPSLSNLWGGWGALVYLKVICNRSFPNTTGNDKRRR
jgi:hypothetical protein